MTSTALAVLVTAGFSALGVLGDYFLKLASGLKAPLRSGVFLVGFLVYSSTAFGWVFVMRHLKLATVSVVYSMSMILLLTGLGVFVFREPLSLREGFGLVLAIASLVLLVRFGRRRKPLVDSLPRWPKSRAKWRAKVPGKH